MKEKLDLAAKKEKEEKKKAESEAKKQLVEKKHKNETLMQETNDKELQSLQNLTSHFLLTDEVEEETDPDKMGFLKKLEWKA